MNVKELIERLKEFDQNEEVRISMADWPPQTCHIGDVRKSKYEIRGRKPILIEKAT